jgi:hypothetical protein
VKLAVLVDRGHRLRDGGEFLATRGGAHGRGRR